ncbi:putative GNAT family N-acetyltransferase [Rosellinia necatrix]|uniref:Putative GNAT family N-acetyltransferase n=1 Tax=Rosellinia necatrix TaxID=77044 RepID=A0A1W2TML6_ROSNE|nr:putative GNAT family N-acetyltransferase [Rosellinia necatrix]
MTATNLPADYILVEGYPNVRDYLNLRNSTGLSPRNEEQASAALRGSWYGVYIAEKETPTKAIAMGRVIGDGGWYFLIADMMTAEEHQRKGLGDVVLKSLLAGIRCRAARGNAYVTLGADPPGRRLYQKNGFKETMPQVMGMGLMVECDGGEE